MYKIIRKIYLIAILLFSVLLFVSCSNISKNDQQKLEDIANNLFKDINTEQVTEDLVFETEINGASVKWLSGNTSVISNQGIVTRPTLDVVVEVYAMFKLNEASLSKSYQFKVLGLNSPGNNTNDDYLPYYDGVSGLSGIALKNFLHDLIDDHQEYTYDYAKAALKETDEDPNNPNNVILFYTGRSQAKTLFGSGINDWNREHVWAKSHGGFGESRPAGSDLHNLRPTDSTVNSTRGNDDFDEGGTKVNDEYGPASSFSYSDSDSFEPRDEVKGDVARILFYMAVRYDGSDATADLELNDRVNNGTSRYMGRLSILLKWNKEDPVDDFERNRNEVIFSYQKNRNPFIDYPEFADFIWGAEVLKLYTNREGYDLILETIDIVVDYSELKRKEYMVA